MAMTQSNVAFYQRRTFTVLKVSDDAQSDVRTWHLARQPQPLSARNTLAEFSQKSQLTGVDLDLSRDKSAVRLDAEL
jgi:hypothetical protein